MGFSRVTNRMRVSGDVYDAKKEALRELDDVPEATLERLFPGQSEDRSGSHVR